MVDAQKLWNQTKENFQYEQKSELFISTFKEMTEIYKYSDGFIYLVVDNLYTKHRIDNYYLNTLNKILKSLTDEEISYKFITLEEANKENSVINNEKIESNKTIQSNIQRRMLRSEYTFDKFMIGEANKEAVAFAKKVVQSDKVMINPFYIFGDVGLGKTHLMNAVGHYILDKNPSSNVVYVTSQQFVDDFFKAKNRNQKNTTLAEEFDRFYSQADVLLVDDIQFLENKQGSQEEFFKIFEELFNQDKQIIVTSDRPASELNIMARLKSRFSWGMQTNLKKPNLELRKSIALDKIKYMIEDPIDIPNDVIDFICENFDENVRELEGAIRRLVSYCVSFNFDFNLENAKMALEPILATTKSKVQEKNTTKFEVIKEAVVHYFNINANDLTSTSRKKNLVYARDLAIFIAKSKFDISFNQLGDALGHRDHATIMHSYQKTSILANEDETIRTDAANIVKIIEKSN